MILQHSGVAIQLTILKNFAGKFKISKLAQINVVLQNPLFKRDSVFMVMMFVEKSKVSSFICSTKFNLKRFKKDKIYEIFQAVINYKLIRHFRHYNNY